MKIYKATVNDQRHFEGPNPLKYIAMVGKKEDCTVFVEKLPEGRLGILLPAGYKANIDRTCKEDDLCKILSNIKIEKALS